jgi:16S rRNA (guanine966-N2)-methyltransferase
VLKVCAGTARGTILKSPRAAGVRPTLARVRQAIFSALSGKTAGSHVLDLYAGTGAMGIEALSQGAAQAAFVDISPKCLRTIKENLELAGLSARASIVRGDAPQIVRRLGRQNRKFDIVILDPPYEASEVKNNSPSLIEKTLRALVESDILRANSRVIVEHSERVAAPEAVAGLKLLSARRYGDTSVSVFTPS